MSLFFSAQFFIDYLTLPRSIPLYCTDLLYRINRLIVICSRHFGGFPIRTSMFLNFALRPKSEKRLVGEPRLCGSRRLCKKIAACNKRRFQIIILLSANHPTVILSAIHHIIRIDHIICDLKNNHIAFFKQDISISIFREIFRCEPRTSLGHKFQ